MAYLAVQSLVLGDEEIAAMRNASSTYMALLLFVVTLVMFALMLVFVTAANGEARSHRLLMTQHRMRLSRYALDAPCCERAGIERLNAELELAIERIDVRAAPPPRTVCPPRAATAARLPRSRRGVAFPCLRARRQAPPAHTASTAAAPRSHLRPRALLPSEISFRDGDALRDVRRCVAASLVSLRRRRVVASFAVARY